MSTALINIDILLSKYWFQLSSQDFKESEIALGQTRRWKALFFPTREQERHRSAGPSKHGPYIYETLTGSCVHDRQFHYSESG